MRDHNYFVYILTNKNRSVLYTGVTNDLEARIYQHQNSINKLSFTWRYNCYFLIYFEHHTYIQNAIAREKQIKGWVRKRKVELIEESNPEWKFLNKEILSNTN